MLGTFALVAGFSLFQHQRTASTLRLLHAGYLPLALTVGEVRASQAVLGTLVDRLLEEADPAASRNWLGVALRVRPRQIARAIDGAEQLSRLNPPATEQMMLEGLKRGLRSVQALYVQSDPRYTALFDAIRGGQKERSEAILAEIRANEQMGQRQLRAVWARLQQHIAHASQQADAQEQRSVIILAILALLALTVGVSVTMWSNRLLAPLPSLQQRVEAVTQGDLKRHAQPSRDDELGRLAANFEQMVDTLAKRSASLKVATEKLIQNEQLAAIGRISAQVTHEVRNPLSSIGLNVELLEEELSQINKTTETHALLAAIRKEIDRLAQITEKYLSLKRLPDPRLELEDVGEVVRAVVAFLEPELDAANLTLSIDLDPAPRILIDEGQLRQALLNLVRNCKEAMPRGGRIWLSVRQAEDHVHITIRDEGTGISREDLSKIFSPFFTTKPAGTGLGLPLTQQIVLAHGGQIRCESRTGQGTSFILSFPLTRESHISHAHRWQAEPPTATG
ncbi:MAG: HAMP domain-containing protein [Myxococcales bacterium]|nr:HAMP domain-containing protein [Myxococcales bacterium]